MRITRQSVDQLLENSDYATYENPMNHIKGIYKKSIGQAFSFQGLGKTWAEVFACVQRMQEN